jgi:hypothetical protein
MYRAVTGELQVCRDPLLLGVSPLWSDREGSTIPGERIPSSQGGK